MQDPVKTVDGMTYDRPAIDRWLHQHTTSPLTGLCANCHRAFLCPIRRI